MSDSQDVLAEATLMPRRHDIVKSLPRVASIPTLVLVPTEP
jgi:hypothetical protein